MIRSVHISNFKKFDRIEIELRDRTVIVGPNNSGKTSLLQAIASWSELGETWLENNADLVRDEHRAFHHVQVEATGLRTLALSSFDELWHNQSTTEPVSIEVATDRLQVGFELRYVEPTIADLGPSAKTSQDHLKAYAEQPLKALYVPTLSGLDVREPEYGDPVLETRLAHGKGGEIVRNLVRAVSRNKEQWEALQNTLQAFFGYELAMPSGSDPIRVRYRHSPEEHWYDLTSGSAGFLQTVLLQSALLHSDASIFLLDEPDAHLHALLKEKMYRLLREYCEVRGQQAVIATHSGRLIDEAARERGEKLFIVTTEGLNPVRRQEAKHLLQIPGDQIVLAETCRRVLYVEGKSDVDILREWAKVLGHPTVGLLDRVLCVTTAQEKGKNYGDRHFRTLRSLVPNLVGLEIRDLNGGTRERSIGSKRESPTGLDVVQWKRYEIENYMIHPNAVSRLVLETLGEEAARRADEYMRRNLPGGLFDEPFEQTPADQTKGKVTIAMILAAAGLDLGESEYYRIAGQMKADEVHPDVVMMLDLIEQKLT
ncbi:MAG: AAA family ATPase [Gammaproteobacteria bacterium]|nr:AAA family ATPase [Gammaproteobacteria bacterium]MCY4276901.1 AAA family ATPase [Gammaproteobacteria bacterium]